MRLKLTQSPTKVGVEVGTELGNYERERKLKNDILYIKS